MRAPERLRAAVLELGLSLGTILVVGIAVYSGLRIVAAILAPEAQRTVGFVVGPLVTALATLVYRWAAPLVAGDDGVERPWTAEPRSPPPRSLAVVVGVAGLGILAAVVGSFLLGHLMELLGFPVEEQDSILAIIEDAKRTGAKVELVALAVSAVLLAPLAEEWMFRGVLFGRLRRNVGLVEAYACSALAFALVHTNPSGLVIYAWLGLVFAVSMRRAGSTLAVAVVVHMANNALALTSLLTT